MSSALDIPRCLRGEHRIRAGGQRQCCHYHAPHSGTHASTGADTRVDGPRRGALVAGAHPAVQGGRYRCFWVGRRLRRCAPLGRVARRATRILALSPEQEIADRADEVHKYDRRPQPLAAVDRLGRAAVRSACAKRTARSSSASKGSAVVGRWGALAHYSAAGEPCIAVPVPTIPRSYRCWPERWPSHMLQPPVSRQRSEGLGERKLAWGAV
jgi:hypothetical protein